MADRDEAPRRREADAVRMDLMEQAKALQFLAAQAAAEAGRLPDKRLDEAPTGGQVFEVVGPDGRVLRRVDHNGNEVKGRE